MGSMRAFAFSELGLDVSSWDVNSENVDKLMNLAPHAKNQRGKVRGFHNIEEFAKSVLHIGHPKLFIFSVTHGHPADSVLELLKPHLKKGDIILDGGNEFYRETERRQNECAKFGVHWIGIGVSGGYQSARHGPSLSPGGCSEVLNRVMPLLKAYAAKDPKSSAPCVANIGPRGSGHYVKMVHNGIEVGMMSALCEAWSLLRMGLGLNNDQVGDVFAKWNASGELHTSFLIRIGSEICKTRKSGKDGDKSWVLDDVLDKVVQDDDGSEGTPMWSIMESASRHISCPTLAAGYYFRTASGNRAERVQVAKNLPMEMTEPIEVSDREAFTEKVRQAVYCAFLSSFCQGLELISRASIEENWQIDLSECIRIWRAGCIIQAEYIADIFEPALNKSESLTNMKFINKVSEELQRNQHALKDVVVEGTRSNHFVPALSATLEYMKYVGSASLPTQFMEAEMDYFGAHSYDTPGVPGEDPGQTAKGHHHYEWKPA